MRVKTPGGKHRLDGVERNALYRSIADSPNRSIISRSRSRPGFGVVKSFGP